jgi:hypothetical protein
MNEKNSKKNKKSHMKNKNFLVPGSLMLMTAIFIGGLQIGLGNTDFTQGNLLAVSEEEVVESPFRDDIDLKVYSIYDNQHSSYGALIDKYEGDYVVEGGELRTSDEHVEGILNYIGFMKNKNPILQARHLPMYPEYNVMTYELAAILNMPSEANPYAAALEKGYIRPNAGSEEFMNRYEYLQLVSQSFFKGDRKKSTKAFMDSGLISDLGKWKEKSQEGFLVTEALEELNQRIIVSLEIESILKSQQQSAFKKIELPQEALTLSDESLRVLLRAASQEDKFDAVKEVWSEAYGNPLSSKLASFILADLGVTAQEIPRNLYLGECSRDLYKKLDLSSLAFVGERGATLTCLTNKGIIRAELSPLSLIVNANKLPVVQSIASEDNPGAELVFVSFPSVVDNMLILGAKGEERLTISFQAFDKEDYMNQAMGVYTATDSQDFDTLFAAYDTSGKAQLHWPLRNMKGKNLRFYVKSIVEREDIL